MAVMLFVGLCVHLESGFSVATIKRLIQYARVCFPIYALFLAIDRGYHFLPFRVIQRYLHRYICRTNSSSCIPPSLLTFRSLGLYWDRCFRSFYFTREVGSFLFDPMLIITAALAIRMWGRLAPPIRAFLTSAIVLLLAYITFHAKISYEAMLPAHTKGWAGDVAWGDRYITAPVQLLAMISVPLLLEFWASLQAVARGIAIGIGAASVTIQIASTIFWCP